MNATRDEPPKSPQRHVSVLRGTIIRAMSPIGIYWRGALRTTDALYSPAAELVFTACHFDEAQHVGDYYSEFDDPMIEEVRLLASLSLPIGWDGGSISLHPHVSQHRLPEFLDLASPDVEARLREMLAEENVRYAGQSATDPPPPPRWGGPSYTFRDAPMPTALQHRLLPNLSLNDPLLLRGLSAWLRAGMLHHYRQFSLEALYSMYMALDASFSLVCRHLKAQGIKAPSAIDAGRFLDEAEGRESEDGPYFGDFYADRIRLFHPESRFGIVPYPPGMVDDLYFLNRSLREVYRLLILGEIVDPLNFVTLAH